MGKSLKNVQDVVSWRLCLGCGACVAVCPEGALTLVDVEEDGLRPKGDPAKCAHCGECLKVCPLEAILPGEERPGIDPEICTDCGTCSDICPARAIEGG